MTCGARRRPWCLRPGEVLVLRVSYASNNAWVGCSWVPSPALTTLARTPAAPNGATTSEVMARVGDTTAQMATRYQHASAERDQQLARRLANLAEEVSR